MMVVFFFGLGAAALLCAAAQNAWQMALALTAVAPVVIIGLVLERYITRGLVAGAIKG